MKEYLSLNPINKALNHHTGILGMGLARLKDIVHACLVFYVFLSLQDFSLLLVVID